MIEFIMKKDKLMLMPSFIFTPIYPVLISLYAVLSLLAYNLGEIYPPVVIRSVVASLLFAFVVWLILWSFIKEVHRSAFMAGGILFLFFSYGHVQIITRIEHPLTYIWLAALILLLTLGMWRRMDLKIFSLSLNIIWIAMIFMTGSAILNYYVRAQKIFAESHLSLPGFNFAGLERDDLPDIYYIILDSYARSDTLQAVYQYDNSAFIAELESLGFSVAKCSQSNFDRTELSFASSLNMDYMQTLKPDLTPEKLTKLPLWAMIQDNSVRKGLEQAGYETIAFATGYPWSEIRDADRYIEPDIRFLDLNEFEVLFLKTTFIRALQNAGWLNYEREEFERYRERTRLILEVLPSLAAREGPQFYFIHILDPHPPFVFNEDGSDLDHSMFINPQGKMTRETYASGYIKELNFINREILNLVGSVIEGSSHKPVIIIQGDHGPWFQPSEYTMPIMNAYYLPGADGKIYPTITPVNTFRIIFNEYLHTDFPLLDDLSYDSPDVELYDYKLVPDQCK